MQEDDPVQLPADAASGSTDLIDYENPADLLCALLQQLGGTASINKLCKVLTGMCVCVCLRTVYTCTCNYIIMESNFIM